MKNLANLFKKIKTGLPALITKLPENKAIRQGTKSAALLCSFALVCKLGKGVYKKINKKVDDAIVESKEDAQREIEITVKRELEKFVLECVIRWLSYIALIMIAYIVARAFNLRRDVLIAFVILGIYAFYIIKSYRVCSWYVSFCRKNGLMFNPLKILRAYLRRAVQDNMQRVLDGLSLPEKLALNFFGPKSDKIASEITDASMQSSALRKGAIARIAMWVCGWIVYLLVYEKLFLLVAGLDFKSVWASIVWPFSVLIKILSPQ